MDLRQRKNTLTAALKVHLLTGALTEQEFEAFRLMYAGARTQTEQNRVAATVRTHLESWKTAQDRFSRVVRSTEGVDEEDDPVLAALIAKFGVKVG